MSSRDLPVSISPVLVTGRHHHACPLPYFLADTQLKLRSLLLIRASDPHQDDGGDVENHSHFKDSLCFEYLLDQGLWWIWMHHLTDSLERKYYHCPHITEKKAEVRNEDGVFHCTPSMWQQRSWTRLTSAESEHSSTVLAMGDNPLTNSVIRLKLIQTLFSDIRGGEMAHVVSPLCPAARTLLSHPKWQVDKI